tara:strand:+ start:4637 stop:6295 length:1659 start_codon:yes stop_codon:yes gene_type:complete
MSSLITEQFRIHNADKFLKAFDTTNSGTNSNNIYFFIGRHESWYTAYAANSNYGTSSSPTASEGNVPVPYDNGDFYNEIHDDILSLKKIGFSNVRKVVRRYNWVQGQKFTMYKPDYNTNNQTAQGTSQLLDSQFYVMNPDTYEIFKVLNNGVTPTNPTGGSTGSTAPTAAAANSDNIVDFTSTDGYVYQYLYKLETNDVLFFTSTDFIPVKPTSYASSVVSGALDIALLKTTGSGLPVSQDLYFRVKGDGDDVTNGYAVLKLTTSAAGQVTAATITTRGRNYTYATVDLAPGATYYTSVANLRAGTPAQTLPASGYTSPSVEVIIPPQNGHGSQVEKELGAKRIMLNTRLIYGNRSTAADKTTDFYVDQDFRRIGVLKDPTNTSGTALTSDTASGTFAAIVKTTPGVGSGIFAKDEVITQSYSITRGTETITVNAKGRVVDYYEYDSSNNNAILRYTQSPNDPELRDADGSIYPFYTAATGGGTVNNITSPAANRGIYRDAQGTIQQQGTFSNGLCSPEYSKYSGDVIYVENRRVITRAADQIEDVKLVIEF